MNFNKKQKRTILLTIIAILLLILIFLIISIIIINKSNIINKDVDISIGYKSIREIVEANGCKYKKDSFLENREYPVEVELGFKYDLYTNEESNEVFFMKIIDEIVKFVRFINVRMIDQEKDITIEIVCKNGKIDRIIINGIDDYFIYMDSKISISKYAEIKTVSLEPTADILRTLNLNLWNSNIDCGTRDSIFQNYFLFFDEGVKYRKIGSTIYNFIFTENYVGDVVNNVSVGESINSVKTKLGEPSFEDKELGIIGYKGNEFYAFFTGKEISIYRRTSYDYSDFWNLVDDFVKENSTMSFKEFMNELTYIWSDYSEYKYDSDYMFISYPNKGIDVKLNYDNESGIVIYNNISESLSKVQRYMENTEFLSKLQIDNVFEAEKRRVAIINSLNDKCGSFIQSLKKESDIELACGESNLFQFYIDLDDNNIAITTFFISKNGENVDRELNEPINSYVWINDNFFVYGIYNKGLYCYNVLDGSKQTLLEGKENFLIKSFENNVIYYDEKELPISF